MSILNNHDGLIISSDSLCIQEKLYLLQDHTSVQIRNGEGVLQYVLYFLVNDYSRTNELN